MHPTTRRAFFALCFGLALFVGVLLSLDSASATSAPRGGTVERGADPVIVVGSVLTDFVGLPIDELALYRFHEGMWHALPFQIDERTDDVTGTFVVEEDGLLDANDELVFMAQDVGEAAGSSWPEDEAAREHERLAIQVEDPLSMSTAGWVYLFHSASLPASATSYVSWDAASQTITAISYTASFSDAFIGLADLTINGEPTDILDRQKIRVSAYGGLVMLNEEGLTDFLTPTVTIPVVGPVRGVSSGGAFNVAVYGSRFDSLAIFDTSGLGITLDAFRTSFDLNDPALTGINRYFDSNGVAVTIDGMPDDGEVLAVPPINWYQASGEPGGIFVALPHVDAGGGATTTYYKDDSSYSPNDTGDHRSFGDTGLRVDDPGTRLELGLSTYILPPGSTSDVGASYFARLTTPLTTLVTSESFGAGGDNSLFLPLVMSQP